MRNLGLALVVVVILAAWYWSRRDHNAVFEGAEARQETTEQGSAGGPDAPARGKHNELARAEPSPSASDFTPVLETDFTAESRWELGLVAQTPAEAHWLEAHGYPRPNEWRNRADVPQAELEKRSEAGDAVAMTMLAERIAKAGDPLKAQELLDRAFENGSVFSQLVLANLVETMLASRPIKSETGRTMDQPRSIVVGPLLVAAQMGDYRASEVLASLRFRLSAADLRAAMMTAGTVIAQTNERRAQRGLGPLAPSLRPGALEAQAAVFNGKPVRAWRGW